MKKWQKGGTTEIENYAKVKLNKEYYIFMLLYIIGLNDRKINQSGIHISFVC